MLVLSPRRRRASRSLAAVAVMTLVVAGVTGLEAWATPDATVVSRAHLARRSSSAPSPASQNQPAPAPVAGDRAGASTEGRAAPGVGDLPAVTALLVVLLAGGAVLTSYVLGPAGDPDAGRGTRRGPVARTLERRGGRGGGVP